MILTGNQILLEQLGGNIKIDPFSEENVTTNSYDLTLGNHFIKYTDEILDPKIRPHYESIFIKDGDFIELAKNEFILACTKEKIGSEVFVPIIHAKSGTARMGLFVHVTADLIDIGSYGVSTLQLYATLPCRIYPGMKLAQVSFWKTLGDIKLYDGKYQGSTGPRVSEIWRDFQNPFDLNEEE